MADTLQTILCVASYVKGQEFIRQCKRQGCTVYLLTMQKFAEDDWPRDCIDEVFYLPDTSIRNDVILGVSHLARTHRIDRIVPLDDYDVETVAALREHLRVPGMGDTTARYLRDKLAMRVRARDRGVPVPDFVHALNYDAIREFMARVPPPWVLKPRSEAAAMGIKKVDRPDELWPLLEGFGDRQSYYVLERFVPGDVFHVDGIVWDRRPVFAEVHTYAQPPMEVAHGGGVFRTRTMRRGSPEERELKELNARVVDALGFVRGVMHTEFIRGREDGRLYFLETAGRVGGAQIAEMVEAATGVNLWAEWAKIEIAQDERPYEPPPCRRDYAGVIISLARQEARDTSAYRDPEIVWRLKKKHHVGFVLRADDPDRIARLQDEYARRFLEEFTARMPVRDRPPA